MNDSRFHRAGCWKVLVFLVLGAVWVCGAEWREQAGYRIRPVMPTGSGRPGFVRLDAGSLGISFTNFVSESRAYTNRNLTSGSGVALGDVDGDGWVDVFLCGIDVAPRLFRNEGGWRFSDGTGRAFPGGEFGRGGAGSDATGTVLADVDGDGDLDLLLNALGRGTRLWRNDGTGRFEEATDAAGLRSRSGPTSMALADVDGDGDLDLYVCNFRPDTIMDRPWVKFSLRNQGGRPVVTAMDGRPTTEPDLTNRFELGMDGQVLEFGEPDVLWLNQGSGRFQAASWTDGTFLDEDGRPLSRAPNDWGLAAHLADLNGDGRPDLYVCNDLHTPDRLWINQSSNGRAVFRAIERTALRSNSTFSMGVDFGDLNRDGFSDLFMVDMLARRREDRARQAAGLAPVFRTPGEYLDRVQLLRNALQVNRGDNTFAETGIFSGVEASDWSWGPIFLDVDLDGYEDILVTNGQLRDFQDSDGDERIAAAQRGGRTLGPADIIRLAGQLPNFATPNVLFRNRTGERMGVPGAGGLSPVIPVFSEVAEEWGFATSGISQGAALADLDGDGDLDVVVNNLLESPWVYRNDATAPRVAVRLRSTSGNTQGIGAKVTVRLPAGRSAMPREQYQHLISGCRYLSGDEALRVFATGTGDPVELEVRWPSGAVQRLVDVPANVLVEVREVPGRASDGASVARPTARLQFADVSDRLEHVHRDEPFEDTERQPLIPHKLSQLGPGVAWADLNGDGWDDLVIGAGRSGTLSVYDGDGRGGFRRRTEPFLQRPLGRDLTTVLPMGETLLAGSSHWEDGQTNGGAIRLYDLAAQRSGEAVLGVEFSVGPLAAADVDGDGALEVFVGARARAGRWPESAPSLLLRSEGGRLAVASRFEQLGRVSAACFTDLDGDGDADLVTVGDWGPVRMLRNDRGGFAAVDPVVRMAGAEFRFSRFSGLWNSVTSGDFDGDGRLDLVAGNWGLNNELVQAVGSGWQVQRPESLAAALPLRVLFFGDLGGAGGADVVEAIPSESGHWPARELPMWMRAFPWLRSEVPTYAAFSQATVESIFGKRLEGAGRLEVRWLASTVFLNRGDSWEARPLPDVAQLSPAFGLVVADADGDGHEDVFLAQNWFGTDPLTPRQDAGRGLWLLGDGTGSFVADWQSGVALYGDQRAAAVSDFDRDGRTDLVVTQNGGRTALYRNERAQPGLRVALRGAGGNPTGVGASVRAIYGGNRTGPWREVHLGAGYWSVDSATPVLARPEPLMAVEVRWPGGRLQRLDVPADARSVQIDGERGLRVVP